MNEHSVRKVASAAFRLEPRSLANRLVSGKPAEDVGVALTSSAVEVPSWRKRELCDSRDGVEGEWSVASKANRISRYDTCIF